MVKLSSDLLSECLCHLVKRQLLIPFFLPSVQYIVNCAYSTAVIYPSFHGMVEYKNMNQCKIIVWQQYTVWFYYNGRTCVCHLLYGFPLKNVIFLFLFFDDVLVVES